MRVVFQDVEAGLLERHEGAGGQEAAQALEAVDIVGPAIVPGDLLEGEEPFLLEAKSRKTGRKSRPAVDDTLYDL